MHNLRWWYETQNDSLQEVSWDELLELGKNGTIGPDTKVYWDGAGVPISFKDVNAEYFYLINGVMHHAYSEDELHHAFTTGNIPLHTKIWGKILPNKGITYSLLPVFDINFSPTIREFKRSRTGCSKTVLSGLNNSGKSLILKLLHKELGPTSVLLSSNRFYNMDGLGQASATPGQYQQRYEQYINQLYSQKSNVENTDFPIGQIISQMSNAQRKRLWEVASEMLGEPFTVVPIDPDNDYSPRRVNVGEESLGLSSTGTRLLLMIIAACVDTNTRTILIDEPEIGLSPRLQSILVKYLLDDNVRKTTFPHIQQIYVVTHSHLFLDKSDFTNNFIVTKDGKGVTISPTKTISSFHDLQFNLLGNDLEALFLPSAILIVEGITDERFIKRLLQIFLPDRKIAIVNAKGEGNAPDKLEIIKSSLGDLRKSPYKDRILVLLDSKHSVKMRDFTKYGIPKENVKILDKNGIEYYYPQEILSEIFSCGSKPWDHIQIVDDYISGNGIQMSKSQLSDEIILRMTTSNTLPPELENKLFSPLKIITGA